MRAFIAAHFEKNMELDGLFETLSSDRRIRIVPEEQWHVTLLFFEDLESSRADQICGMLSSLNGGEFTPVSMGISGFPDPKRARVVVLLLDSPDLIRIKEKISSGSPGEFNRKEFRPHITLARSRKEPADVRNYVELGHGLKLHFNDISLMKSELTPHGPVYTRICGIQLM